MTAADANTGLDAEPAPAGTNDQGAAFSSGKPRPPYKGDRLAPWLMLAPALGLLILLAISPLIYLVYMSFHRQNLFQDKPAEWVGLDNFRYLFDQEVFRSAIWKTIEFSIVTLAVEMVLGFLMASLLYRARGLWGTEVIRTALTTPILIAPIVAALMWRFMYQPDFGVLNYMLGKVGIDGPGWLVDPSIAMWAIAFIDIWQWTPFVMIVILAGMYGLPRRIYEAAELDRTNTLRQTFYITIPLLKRVLLVVLLLRAIDIMRVFDIIVATTAGGPGTSTYTLPIYVWRSGFKTFAMGDAAAASVVLLIIIAGIITFFVRVAAKEGVVGRTAGER